MRYILALLAFSFICFGQVSEIPGPASTATAPCVGGVTTNCSVQADTNGNVTVVNALPTTLDTTTFFASKFPGADISVQINACIAAVIAVGGGTCDAGAFTGSYSNLSQEIQVGLLQEGVIKNGVTLLLPSRGTWAWTITDGISCGILQRTGTAIHGTAAGGGGSAFILNAASSATNMDSLYCTDPDTTHDGGSAYVRADGFAAINYGRGTFANGLIHIQNLFDESDISYVVGDDPAGGKGWIVNNICCGTRLNHIQAASIYGAGGGVPFTITNSSAVSVTNSTINSAGNGKNNLYIGVGNNNLDFIEDYLETNGSSADTSTATVHVDSGAAYVHFIGGQINRNTMKPYFDSTASLGFLQFGIGQLNYVSGIPSVVAQVDLTLQSANTGAVLLYAVPADRAGTYQFSCYSVVTRVATSTSTLPNCGVQYTDLDTNVTLQPYVTGSSSGNTIGASAAAPMSPGVIQVKAGSQVNYFSTNYASSGVTSMQYTLHAKLVYLGN